MVTVDAFGDGSPGSIMSARDGILDGLDVTNSLGRFYGATLGFLGFGAFSEAGAPAAVAPAVRVRWAVRWRCRAGRNAPLVASSKCSNGCSDAGEQPRTSAAFHGRKRTSADVETTVSSA
ncbi:hypothetical protein CC117_30370 [Parafrankia colletiae]|uniref:Uncharacterized protein n=1 Tax=Parafrankia colletiae TaxID=573497 RepID=A0A1S1Q0M3_9ACTN|nr:hypothetical protein CC117_30370 [Parafrankia colletiae]